jgi:hypothetical protein
MTKLVEKDANRRSWSIADTFAAALGRPVLSELIPHEEWETLFRAQGI